MAQRAWTAERLCWCRQRGHGTSGLRRPYWVPTCPCAPFTCRP